MAGNLTDDGICHCGYDAWNRMGKVTKANQDTSSTLHSGSVIDAPRFDDVNCHIEKVKNMPDAEDIHSIS